MRELEGGIQAGNMYSMKTVWERYCEVVDACQPSAVPLRNSNIMGNFRKKIEFYFGDKVELVAQESRKDFLLIFLNLPQKAIFQHLQEECAKRGKKEPKNKTLKALSETDADNDLRNKVSKVIVLCKQHD